MEITVFIQKRMKSTTTVELEPKKDAVGKSTTPSHKLFN